MDDNKNDLNQTEDEKKSIGTVRYSNDEMADEDKTVSLFVNSRQKKQAPPEPVQEEMRQAAPVAPPVVAPVYTAQIEQSQQQAAKESTPSSFLSSFKKRPLGTKLAIIAAPLIFIIILIIAFSGSDAGSENEKVGSFYDPESGFYFEFPTYLEMTSIPGAVVLEDTASESAFFVYYTAVPADYTGSLEEAASFQLETIMENLKEGFYVEDYMVGIASTDDTVYTNATYNASDDINQYIGTAEVVIMDNLMVGDAIVAKAENVERAQQLWQSISETITAK